MRFLTVSLLCVITWTGVAVAQTTAVPEDGSDGDLTTISAGGGSPTAQTKQTCKPTATRPCPKICDVLLFDGVSGGISGACTVYRTGCTPPGGAPRSCDDIQLGQAQVAAQAGGEVTLNQYTGTPDDPVLRSTPIGTSEMNSIMGSFLAQDENFMASPPMTAAEIQSVQDQYGEYLAGKQPDNFMTGAPPPVSQSSWGGLVPPVQQAAQDVSYSSWGGIPPYAPRLSEASPNIDYSFWEHNPGTFAYPGQPAPYSASSFRFDSGVPSVSPFTPDAGPFDFNPNPSRIPSPFSSTDYTPRLDRLDPAEVPTSPFSWYSPPGSPAGGSPWGAYNPFEPYQGREVSWADNLPADFGQTDTFSEPPSDPAWYERAWSATKEELGPLTTRECWASFSCVRDRANYLLRCRGQLCQ